MGVRGLGDVRLDAAHSTVAAIGAGLDMEMPGGTHFGAPLQQAVRGGSVPEAAVDLAVRRILATMDRFGLLAGRTAARPGRDPAAGSRVARRVATAGAVLLRNEHAILPLTGAAARSIAVIGPTVTFPSSVGAAAPTWSPTGPRPRSPPSAAARGMAVPACSTPSARTCTAVRCPRGFRPRR
ncbi:hypothetical protein AB0B01_20375 [Streptomyces sp. NPDC044571]|uniref:hypothetical protein n=1 Tax=Streptomyces sp. NPDC044571 TaxID=3155371 RepID=UPI0033F8C013